jgi:hypothetical protein
LSPAPRPISVRMFGRFPALDEKELERVDQGCDPTELHGDDHREDGDVLYPVANETRRRPNLGLVACLVFCLACWAGLVYLIGLALG